MGKIPADAPVIESFVPEGISGKTIYVVMTAAKKVQVMPDFIDTLREKGANVFVFWSENATELFGRDKKPGLASLLAERVVNDYKSKSLPDEDILVVMPCTFNTLSKIANGIADNYITSIVQDAIARKKPVIIVPAYNEYWHHPLNLPYIERLQSWNITVVFPDITPHKVTMITPHKVLDVITRSFTKTKFTSHRLSSDELEALRNDAVGKFYKDFSKTGKQQEADRTNSSVNGCYSTLINDEWILISAAGSQLAKLTPDDLTLLHKSFDEKEGVYWVGKKPPSSESPLHIKMYQISDSRAVMHSHSPAITYSGKYDKYSTDDYIPYGEYGALQPIQEMVSSGKKFFILKYHGEVALGKDLSDAHKVIQKLSSTAAPKSGK